MRENTAAQQQQKFLYDKNKMNVRNCGEIDKQNSFTDGGRSQQQISTSSSFMH